MSRVLVTGATGFVGGGIARRLLADGREVRALSRRPEAATALQALGAEVVPGDVLAPETVEEAARGCDVVYHAAGVNGFCMRDPGPMRAANVTGTENVIAACARAGVRRVVYTSSAAVIGEEAGVVATEDTPHRGWFLSEYERSKHDAEVAAMRAAAGDGIELVCVNPASVQGPGRTGGTARLILDYANGKLRTLVRSRFSLVDADDCSEGHLLAEARGVPGRRYLLAGVTVTTEEAVATLARVTGIERRALNLPRPLALAAGDVVATAARVRGRRPRLCREMVATLLHGHAYDGSRAARELGLEYRSFDAMVRRTLAWYVDQGMVNGAGIRADRTA
ncbi:MAG TPA: NAD-dependent epimerase/dehydratase family protein [Gaiellales bacterium]|nr:NAD-dependent epimerase/dehydratase family protein [Gaiellales bacterium]